MGQVQLSDIAKAKAFTMWAENVTGIEPQIVNHNNEYLEIDFTPQEKAAWIKYLDGLIIKSIKPQPSNVPPPTVQIRFGNILVPWASRYIVGILIGGFIMGRLSKKRRR